jgi:serine/threonine-protein kinase
VRLIDPRSTVRVIGQVAKGLTKAHAIGIVHRDLKPENIHLIKHEDGHEIAKILDFGLAKFYSPVDADEKTARLTREGAVFGTPAYMSPEQVKGQGSVDHRADLWALGCMAFECLTGRPVWNTDQGVAMTFAAIATGQLPVPSRLRPDLPPAFDAWFRRALERDPNKRFQSAKELADELARALDTGPISLVNAGGTPSQIELDALVGFRDARSVAPPPPSSEAMGGGLPPAPGSARRSSEPVDLFAGHRAMLPSSTDLPATAAPEDPFPLPRRRRSRIAGTLVTLLVLGGLGGGGYALYPRVRARLLASRTVPAPRPTAAAASGAASELARAAAPPPEQPKWMGAIEDGQQLLASGDFDGALRKFKEAADGGGGAVARSFLDQAKLGAATTGPCRMASLARPRYGIAGTAGRPAVAATSRGAVLAWTDDHEQPGHDHVYSVLVDAIGRPTSGVRDLTPEADYAMRPVLLPVGDRVVLLFWDRSGRQPGVKARWLDADGRIGGMSVDVGPPKPGNYWPTIDRIPDGSGFWAAWQANPEKEGDDIFLRRLDAELLPQGSELRATDYEPIRGKAVKASSPSLAVSGANVFVAFALEREHQSVVERMRVPLASQELVGAGVIDKGAAKGSREIGDALVANDDKVGGDYPSIACTADACYLVWHELDKGGAQAALVDPTKGTLLWRKRFAPRGGHPAVASSSGGEAEVVFYEAGRVRVASISRDGVGTTSTFAHVAGDPPRAWIAPGRARGEWLVSWLDLEAGRFEPFLARLACRN